MDLSKYTSFGDVDATDYTPTKADQRKQAEAVQMSEDVARMAENLFGPRAHAHLFADGDGPGTSYITHTHDDDEPGHVHEPDTVGGLPRTYHPSMPIPPRTTQQQATLRKILSAPTPPHTLMRWRLRLFCGHVIEQTIHMSQYRPGSDRECPKCGLNPAAIIGARPLGLAGERPVPKAMTAAQRTRAERRLQKLDAEAARLRADLARRSDEP